VSRRRWACLFGRHQWHNRWPCGRSRQVSDQLSDYRVGVRYSYVDVRGASPRSVCYLNRSQGVPYKRGVAGV
jgi:hypothetical protein